MRLLASRPDAAATVARARDAARARRAARASMDPLQRAARHAMRMAGTTALQDLLAEVAGRRREAHDTAARIRDFARARRAGRGGACGEADGGYTYGACEGSHAAARGRDGTAARARVRADAAAAAANSTIGLH